MSQKTLWLGAGHSPASPGVNHAHGLWEYAVNIQVTDKVYALLQGRGLPVGVGGVVRIPHEHDLGPSIDWVRSQGANRARGDIAIELHLQKARAELRGAFILYGRDAKDMARTLLDEYLARGLVGSWAQGIYRSTTAAQNWRNWDDYGWNKGLDPYAFTLIFEMGHLTNAEEAALFGDPTRQQIQAQAVAAGLYRIFTGQGWEVPGIFRAPSITLDQFRAILMQAASPLTGADIDIAYWMCSMEGVDPAFPLALFRHTTTYGNISSAVSARNPGLLSQGSDGVSWTVNLANLGPRQQYHAWLDGWRAMIHHLNVYHRSRNHQTVAEILADWDGGADMSHLAADVEATMRGWA